MFRKPYKLSEGDVGTFTLDKQEGVINLTQLVKSNRPIKQETPMGTQSCYGDANVQMKISGRQLRNLAVVVVLV
ncbi:hypothetical protein HanRHA438_Chr06g0251481 [Helianthus annuus]|uniref:Uncharacterized protein n=1 Tax=Helianthus annuus TaxID=4232 RepID=A0A9K3NHT5_HELAN|nr:hypothetical protein HanXRQr2_Chr06g0242461 [Helianthus annuus]KAJ0572260.1 hypothetical protein HanHA89_Chr06g0213811 [Helianthus annuus]KAJ0736715.1 hypothetical protein HanLR1_Chr06g0198981 [Helianthus annuus]KAJ0910361.1 hypothetical protein HanRHA438_Chr06g0251481 [Helianthus annuus]